jgi:hypothetical protein
MKTLFPALLAALALLAGGCVTQVHTIQLTGDIMVDGPRAIAEGPPKDKVLWQYRTAAGAMQRGDFATAKQMLDDALLTLNSIYGKDSTARKSRSYFEKESKKNFIGEPYERVMAYFYRGIIYWMDGEPDNARACFRSGQFEDSSSEGEQFVADYVLLDYLDGYVTTRMDGDGSDAFARSQKESRMFRPPAYDKDANVLFFVAFGPAPRKSAIGEYGQELHLTAMPSPERSAVIRFDDQAIAAQPYDDLGFQATTRGGRLMDHVLANKAVFKRATDAVGNAAIVGGAIAATSDDHTAQAVGLGLIAAGLISKIISQSTTPGADVRAWDNLPRYLSFVSMRLTPGVHTATIEFLDRAGQPILSKTKSLTINVTEDKRDKVVFVSDESSTPQTL